MQLAGEQDEARVRRGPGDLAHAGNGPGKDTGGVGVQQPFGFVSPADGQQAVHLRVGQLGRREPEIAVIELIDRHGGILA